VSATLEPPVVVDSRLLTPTGLDRAETLALSDADRNLLAGWHRTKAGDDNGKPWWPNAIRSLPFDERLRLAGDPYANFAWEKRERWRVETDLTYFTTEYGHVQPPEGPPLPFTFWDRQPLAEERAVGALDQGEVLDAFRRERRVVVLKARQLGLTWLALHYAIWLLEFNPATPNARVLGLSKHGGDATKLLGRARRINALLPPFLRQREDTETARSLTRYKVEGRGEMASLAGSPEAARMETATLALLDEFAFIRNKQAGPTWTAILPTLGRQGRAIVISTGNGPAESPGDGQAFASLWNRSMSGDDEAGHTLYPIFLPSSTHPDRDDDWRAREVGNYLTVEEFEQEYPETEDQALQGIGGLKVYPPAGINAAEKLGRKFDDLLARGRMAPPAGETLVLPVDFGEFTHMLILWPLEAGGIYVAGEVSGGGHAGLTTKGSTRALLDLALEHVQREDHAGALYPLFGHVAYDAAGVESARTMREVIREDADLLDQFEHRIVAGRAKVAFKKVRFNVYKTPTKDYLQHLFHRTALGETTRVIGISQRCSELLRQLRGLEMKDDGTGTIEKGDDHGPDSLIAGAARIAARHRGMIEPDELEDER
jgi:hypothetical protein